MDQTISAIIGAIIFIAFTAGLAESIGSIPFFLIVGIVIVLMGFGTIEVIKKSLKNGNSNNSSD